MKSLFFTACAFFAFSLTAHAQLTTIEDQDNIQDKIQQEPPPQAQVAMERAAHDAHVNAQNKKNVREADDQLTKEKERSTGKESKNPAEDNPRTVKPATMGDPVSAPVKK